MHQLKIASTDAEIIGTGNPLLVLHGGPGLDSSYLVPWLRPLSRKRSLVFYDQIGCGRDTTPLERVSAQAVIEQAEEFVHSIAAVSQPGILAHSWGAYLVYELLRRGTANDLGFLILVSPVGLTRGRFDASGDRLLARIPASVIAALEQLSPGHDSGAAMMRALSPYYQAHPRQPAHLTFQYYSQAVYDRVLATVGDYDCRDIAHRLPKYTLILYGDSDIVVPSDTAEINSQASVHVLSDSGHLSFAEQPSQFTETVERFLTLAESTTK
ncbi:MAG: Proline iminopeptidase [Dehalococcoidia bacterium]|nr:Proline iminopeptidase [Bacillota bacterium]